MHNSEYDLPFLKNQTCTVLCTIDNFEQHPKFRRFRALLKEDQYRANLRMDNMPAVHLVEATTTDGSGEEVMVQDGRGFPIGIKYGKQYFVTNHITFWIAYHPKGKAESMIEMNLPGEMADDVTGRIIYVYVSSKSIRHNDPEGGDCMNEDGYEAQEAKGKVTFTYSVRWYQTDQPWSTRWDHLLALDKQETEMNWASIINSLAVALCLSFVVALIVIRAVKRDFARYAAEELDDELDFGADINMSTGWKVVAHDVFRPPQHPEMLSILCGTGSQLFWVLVLVVTISLFGFFSPSNRGVLLSSSFVFFSIFGYSAGHCASSLYKKFKGLNRKTVIFGTAFLIPSVYFGQFFVMNLSLWHAGSTGAVPFSAMFTLCLLWFGISVPLTFLGGYFGFREEEEVPPCKVNQIPRQIPDKPWYIQDWFLLVCSSSVLFSMLFVHVFYITSKIWLQEFVYIFGFIMVLLLLFTICCAEVAIITVYLTLCAEDYKFHWRAWSMPASVAVPIYFFTTLYLMNSMPGGTALTHWLLMNYMFIASSVLGLVGGLIGFESASLFVTKIYEGVKKD